MAKTMKVRHTKTGHETTISVKAFGGRHGYKARGWVEESAAPVQPAEPKPPAPAAKKEN